MYIDLDAIGLTQGDIRLLLSLCQAGYAMLASGLLFSWIKNRHPGVLLSSGVFGTGAYFSYADNNWWPLGVSLAAGHILKSIGFHMGYH